MIFKEVLRGSPLMILKGQSLQGQGHKRLYQTHMAVAKSCYVFMK